MNSSRYSLKSNKSSLSQKGFRTLIKSRFNHSVQAIQTHQNKASRQKMNQNDETEENKNNIKKYIRSMKLNQTKNIFNRKSRKSFTKQNQSQVFNKLNDNLGNKTPLLRKSLTSNILRQQSIPKNVLRQQTKNVLRQQSRLSPINMYNSLGLDTKNNFDIENNEQYIKEQEGLPILKSNLQTRLENTQSMNKIFLDLIEEKVLNLMNQKIINFSNINFQKREDSKNASLIVKAKAFQKQIDRILKQITQIRQAEDQDVSLSITHLDRKVKIIQKLIAQKLAQSDCIKNKYLFNLKKHHKTLMNSSKSSLSNLYFRGNQKNNCKYQDKKVVKSNFIKQTTNSISFNAPKKGQYAIPVKQNHFKSDKFKQPLPRSSYNRQFLNYKGISKDLFRVNKAQSLNIFNQYAGSCKSVMRTSYHQNFLKKTVQKIDFKSLDCYKDKITDLDVKYNSKDNLKITNRQNPECYNQQRETQKSIKVAKQAYIRTHYPSKYLMSQSRAVFGQKARNQFESRVRSEIKHKNLSQLKYSYQKLVNQSSPIKV